MLHCMSIHRTAHKSRKYNLVNCNLNWNTPIIDVARVRLQQAFPACYNFGWHRGYIPGLRPEWSISVGKWIVSVILGLGGTTGGGGCFLSSSSPARAYLTSTIVDAAYKTQSIEKNPFWLFFYLTSMLTNYLLRQHCHLNSLRRSTPSVSTSLCLILIG